MRDLVGGGFITQQRNVVLVGGTGAGKTHLAAAIARTCIRAGSRGRFFTTVDLVNQLAAESRAGRPRPFRERLELTQTGAPCGFTRFVVELPLRFGHSMMTFITSPLGKRSFSCLQRPSVAKYRWFGKRWIA